MKKSIKKNLTLAALAAGGLLLAGCQAEVYEPAGAAQPGYDVSVDVPPPAPYPDEVVGVAPGPDFVWVGGGWDWHGRQWEYQKGHWGRPPYAGAHWEPNHYDAAHHSYQRGHWK